MPSGRSRKFCWTLHARNEAEGDAWGLSDDTHPPIPPLVGPTYWIYQVEVATSGQVHLQGFSYYAKGVSLRRAKLDVSDRCHITVARGTVEDNVRYCSKESEGDALVLQGPFEGGVRPQQGKRTDWHDAREIVLAHGSDREILDAHPNLAPNWRGVDTLRAVYGEHPIRRDVVVHVLWGPPDTGKTFRARTSFPEAFLVRGKFTEGRTFDDYVGQRCLILDEFVAREWPLTLVNSLLDEFGSWIPCRYHNKYTDWQEVVICTNEDPSEMYYGDPHKPAFDRRLGAFVVRVNNKFEDLVW